jgi:hypothetical protein
MQQVYLIQVHGHNVSVEFSHDAPQGEINVHNVDIQVTTPGDRDIPFRFLIHELLPRAFQVATTAHQHMRHPDNLESVFVSVEIEHQDFHNNGHWYSMNHVYPNAEERITAQWDMHAQSNKDANLKGQSVWRFQFILDSQPHIAKHHFYHRRVGGVDRNTPYAQRKKRMFTPYKQTHIFERPYITQIPNSERQLCFPLAFLMSQCRSIHLPSQEVYESSAVYTTGRVNEKWKARFHLSTELFQDPSGVLDSMGCYYLIPLNEYLTKRFEQYLPNYVYKNHLVLFNCLKTETTNVNWDIYYEAAEVVHIYVESRLGYTVDYTDLEVVANAYAQVFSLNIHLRRLEFVKQTRTNVYKSTAIKHNYDRHVSLLLHLNEETNIEHCHAIIHIRELSKSKLCATNAILSGYCDYCCRCITSNHGSVADNKQHIKKCQIKFVQNGYQPDIQINYRFDKCCNDSSMHLDKKSNKYICNLCRKKDILELERQTHLCYMPNPETAKRQYGGENINVNKYFVFDLECAQNHIESTDGITKLRHYCTLICVRAMYDKSYYANAFETLESFVEELITNEKFDKATLFAHNGGSYDFQFLVQYLEQNQILYSATPRPGSIHKYLTLEIKKNNGGNVCFKDFLMFMPGSLRGIAKSLGCVLGKGDFPHKFHTLERIRNNYTGSIPPIDTIEDYYCLNQKKDEQEIKEMKSWFASESAIYCNCYQQPCICGKQPWNMKQQLLTYCWLDVDVLAECMVKFRDQHLAMGSGNDCIDGSEWVLKPIDPYILTTQSQVAQKILLRGHTKMPAISTTRSRHGWSKAAIAWLEYISERDCIHIQHVGNSDKEYFNSWANKKVDGYCRETKTCYEFYGCLYHGCIHCYINREDKHPIRRNETIEEVYQDTMKKQQRLEGSNDNRHVVVIWECEWNEIKQTISYSKLQRYEALAEYLILDREMFYGGRTEVFCPYVKADETHSLDYIDVCSLYPTVCARDELPIGHPTRYFGRNAEQQRHRLSNHHSHRIFGFVRCKIIPNTNDNIGLLPSHTDGKLLFDVRPKTGTWFTEELYLAVSQGYVIEEIYEIFHFDSNNRSNTYMKGYMSYFFRQKQEAEGWVKAGCSSETPSDEEKNEAIQRLYDENPDMLPMRKENVQKNDVKRQVAKIYLNCLWGKFGQSPEQTQSKNVYGFEDFQKLLHDPNISRETLKCRKIWQDYYQCVYKDKKEKAASNSNYNVWIAAAVTAHARCRLHKQMIHIGEDKIAYCDTDSIIYRHPRNIPSYAKSGLGNWVSEFNPNEIFFEYFALAPKAYMLLYTKSGQESSKVKSKGVTLTLINQSKLTSTIHEQLIKKVIWESSTGKESTIYYPIILDHFSIQSNTHNFSYEYASMFSIYTKKLVQAIYTKREIQKYDLSNTTEEQFANITLKNDFRLIRTYPLGYSGMLKSETETVSMCFE